MNYIENLTLPGNAAVLLGETATKGMALLLVTAAAAFVLRRASAASRFCIWFLGLSALLLLPALSLLMPRWENSLWTVSQPSGSGNEVALSIGFGARQSRAEATTPPPFQGAAQPANAAPVPIIATKVPRSWLTFIVAAWSIGFVSLLMRQLASFASLRRLHRRATETFSHDTLIRSLCAELGIRRSVRVLQSADSDVPVTWGFLNPAILLPTSAAGWPADRLEIVMLHELAHIKRCDYASQFLAELACALHWFNPLAWFGGRMMLQTREQACDDIVLNRGCMPSEYATHLVTVASHLRGSANGAAIAMARSSKLQQRIRAITDATRARREPRAALVGLWFLATLLLAATIAAQGPQASQAGAEALRSSQISALRSFASQKHKQSLALAAAAKEEIKPEFVAFFDAAMAGDFQTVTNKYDALKRRHPQYERTLETDESLWVSYWQPVLEICLAYFDVSAAEPKYLQAAVDGFLTNVPPGGVLFGGTDPGRGLPTAFSKSHVGAVPFFTLSQNPLASEPYQDYLRTMYRGRLALPTTNDTQAAFEAYRSDAAERLAKGQLRPGEKVTKGSDGEIKVTGQVAVMAINALITRQIFEKNPGKEFYIEESFPLDWMYPYLEPAGQVMKINRQPLKSLSDQVTKRDADYWTAQVDGMIGPWLRPGTTVSVVTQFAERVYADKDLRKFEGDPLFVRNWWAQAAFSKWRSSIAGLYAWRAQNSTDSAERKRMQDAADFAFRQAYALCPSSPEALYRYVNQLVAQQRYADAISLAKITMKVKPQPSTAQLIRELERLTGQNKNAR